MEKPQGKSASVPAVKDAHESAQDAFFKSLEHFWLVNPGADMSTFLAATKRWDAYYQQKARSKLASSAAILKHDTLVNNRPMSADHNVLARTQYLVSKYIFLSQNRHASLADWAARTKEFSRAIPARVAAFRWKTEDERDDKFSSSILRAVASPDTQDKFHAQELEIKRSRHMYLKAMKLFFLERGDVDGGSAGDRAEEQWTEAQRLWEALQKEHYDYQERQWKEGQEKKLEWEEKRLRVLQQQQQQHQEELDDVRGNQNHEANIEYQTTEAASAAAAVASFDKVQHEHVARQQREQAINGNISTASTPPPQKPVDTSQHGFGVDDAPMGQLAQGGAATNSLTNSNSRDQFVRDFKADMLRHKLRGVREMTVHAMWLQSQADFADAQTRSPGGGDAAEEFGGGVGMEVVEGSGGSAQFGSLADVEKAWHARRVMWQELWQQERDMNAEQRVIDVTLAQALAKVHPKVHPRKQLKAARLQSLYLESDASPDQAMLRHYWKGFTSRPPSRLPAFGSAQSANDLARHASAARKAGSQKKSHFGTFLKSPLHL